MDAPFVLSVVTLELPCHDGARMEAIGAKECSRMGLPRAIRAGTLCYVRPLAGTQLWMAYFRCGQVVKMSAPAACRHLETIRDAAGRPVRDYSGTGDRLESDQNARAGNPTPNPEPHRSPRP